VEEIIRSLNMGKQTRNFRQSGKSLSGNQGARNFNQQNRGAWHSKLINYLKVRGEKNPVDSSSK
jgi:hypothetical protein